MEMDKFLKRGLKILDEEGQRRRATIERLLPDGTHLGDLPEGYEPPPSLLEPPEGFEPPPSTEEPPEAAAASPESCGIDPATAWKSKLIAVENTKGVLCYPCRAHNLMLILENDPEWAGHLRYDEFRCGVFDLGKEWTDTMTTELKAWFELNWIAGEVRTSLVQEAVNAVATRHPYHPIREWLAELAWDGTPRLADFFSDFCGAPATAYTRAVAKSLFVSAVARIVRPGIQVDTMVVLEGAQGIGKTKLVRALFGLDWHCDITEEPGSLDFYQNLRGKWVGEFSELSAMGRADQNRIKQALTQRSDTYRESYGRYSRTYPRQYIFIGNTNKSEYLEDETGGRRYLPIACAEIDDQAVLGVRDQLWAEALALFQTGEQWWDIPDAANEQAARYVGDSWQEYILAWLGDRISFTMTDVLEQALELKTDRHDRCAQIRVGRILYTLGWVKKRNPTDGRKYFYVKRGF